MRFLKMKLDDKNSRGTAALEITMAMPMMLLTLFGTVEFGRAFLVRQTLVNAAGEAIRVGTKASCPRATEGEVVEAANTILTEAGLEPALAEIDIDNAGGDPGTEMIIDIGYNVELPVLSKLVSMFSESGSVDLSVHVEAENE